MSVYIPVFNLIGVALPSAVRNSTQVINGKDLMDPVQNDGNRSGINAECGGIIAYLNITAVPGADTVALVCEEQDPASGNWSVICQCTPTANVGMQKLKIKPAGTAVAQSQTNVAIVDTLPGIWRLRVVHSNNTNFTYSLGVNLYN